MKLIDKDVLVAEIERRRDAALMRQKNLESIGQETVLNEMVAKELNRIIFIIDTLKVKEVDSTDTFIGKACEWLKNHYRDYMHNPTGERLEAFFGGDMCNDFENYMREK